jgi:RHS repeat-associated protein
MELVLLNVKCLDATPFPLCHFLSLTYYLDKMGNRNSVVDTGNTKSYNPNNLNEYSVGDSNPVTNNDQHQISIYNYVNYTYRNDEQLTRAARSDTGISYSLAYDALGRCVARTTNVSGHPSVTKFYIYDGERPILEYDSTGALVGRNVYGKGVDEILMRTDYTFPGQTLNPGVTYYYQQDHEGSAIHLTDTSGNLVERYRYDVYGAPTIYPPSPSATPIPASAVSNRFLFTGREYAGAFGFYEYRARAYNTTLGRFTSEDPKLFDAGDYNLYRYCHNDPLDFTVPMGLVLLSSTSDFVAGAGDFISFGVTSQIRESLPGIYGPGGGVDKASAPYTAGEGAGFALGMVTGEGELSGARGLEGKKGVKSQHLTSE